MTQFYTATTPPRPLPDRIILQNGRVRDDRATFTAAEITDAGYTLAPDKPEFDAETERVVWMPELSDWAIEALPELPAAAPRPLTRLEFVRLCMAVGGMTSALLVQAKADPQLAALWIMLDMAEQVAKDDPEITPGLAALAGLGFLPNGAQAVVDGWPVS